ncbi:MAG: metal ABC transporter permease [Candidatus Xiphinematobacter sp.]|nr:MAG: metal ABC transporter permease [Candidatus Xiphinematobacter sp.]QQY08815.1 MAG: metal ABC transporter permease [Candidatus Xiphinematobacter sp.]QQY11029.1 MAG: metal ABC transporter permease [Candidatus Xiphinematobacter sp.]
MLKLLLEYFSYDFVCNAFIAGSLVGILGAVVGYFVVIRNVSFAAHALAHIGFSGATGAALFGINPLNGMLIISLLAGIGMGISGSRIQQSGQAVGMVLSVCLGVGTLFLAFYKGFAGQAAAILFGNIFGVSRQQLIQIVTLAGVALFVLGFLSRKLLFASVRPDLAEARGISLLSLSVSFMGVLAISVTLASQIVGILLVFALMVGPAGIASRIFHGFWTANLAGICFALSAVWCGILMACLTNWPPSFWITAILFIFYLVSEALCRFVLQR